mmetsp:Transcript_23565/g.59441  ORF Transcript_23565/g.59441 Transcript_23565/m.59441 type:complete len:148 (+) Transcript_23565:574-1017(+)
MSHLFSQVVDQAHAHMLTAACGINSAYIDVQHNALASISALRSRLPDLEKHCSSTLTALVALEEHIKTINESKERERSGREGKGGRVEEEGAEREGGKEGRRAELNQRQNEEKEEREVECKTAMEKAYMLSSFVDMENSPVSSFPLT